MSTIQHSRLLLQSCAEGGKLTLEAFCALQLSFLSKRKEKSLNIKVGAHVILQNLFEDKPRVLSERKVTTLL